MWEIHRCPVSLYPMVTSYNVRQDSIVSRAWMTQWRYRMFSSPHGSFMSSFNNHTYSLPACSSLTTSTLHFHNVVISRMLYNRILYNTMWPFGIGFFHSPIFSGHSFMLLYVLIVHFLLSPSDMPWMDVPVSFTIHTMEDICVVSSWGLVQIESL